MQPAQPSNIGDYYKHLSVFWTDLVHLMSSKPQALASVGPMREFAATSKRVASELIEINANLLDFNRHVTEYYRQLAETWAAAQKKVNAKAPELPRDAEHLEAYKRVWMDTFDNDFTELFDSERFGQNYGSLVSRELELTRRWNNITNIMLQSANLPNREELDEVYRELHSLKKRVGRLELDMRKGGARKRGGTGRDAQ